MVEASFLELELELPLVQMGEGEEEEEPSFPLEEGEEVEVAYHQST